MENQKVFFRRWTINIQSESREGTRKRRRREKQKGIFQCSVFNFQESRFREEKEEEHVMALTCNKIQESIVSINLFWPMNMIFVMWRG